MNEPPAIAFDWNRAWFEHRDNLPHVRQENVVYFVTFRLNDSLPAQQVAELRERRAQWLEMNPPPHTDAQEQEYRRLWTVRIENLLDAGHGACVLREAACREIFGADHAAGR